MEPVRTGLRVCLAGPMVHRRLTQRRMGWDWLAAIGISPQTHSLRHRPPPRRGVNDEASPLAPSVMGRLAPTSQSTDVCTQPPITHDTHTGNPGGPPQREQPGSEPAVLAVASAEGHGSHERTRKERNGRVSLRARRRPPASSTMPPRRAPIRIFPSTLVTNTHRAEGIFKLLAREAQEKQQQQDGGGDGSACHASGAQQLRKSSPGSSSVSATARLPTVSTRRTAATTSSVGGSSRRGAAAVRWE